ncbi:MAG: hypothetical protein WA705_13830 [Candidatus Ozemobacteraceae bacterium]
MNRQYLDGLITVTVTTPKDVTPRLSYSIDVDALKKLSNTYLGKAILITSRNEWNDEMILKAYRSQHVVESQRA